VAFVLEQKKKVESVYHTLQWPHRGVSAQPELCGLPASLGARAELKLKAGTAAAMAE